MNMNKAKVNGQNGTMDKIKIKGDGNMAKTKVSNDHFTDHSEY